MPVMWTAIADISSFALLRKQQALMFDFITACLRVSRRMHYSGSLRVGRDRPRDVMLTCAATLLQVAQTSWRTDALMVCSLMKGLMP